MSNQNGNSALLCGVKLSCMSAKLIQSCLTLCDPIDCGPPGFSVQGILQARILEWVANVLQGDCPGAGIEPGSPVLQADSLPSAPPGKPTIKRDF